MALKTENILSAKDALSVRRQICSEKMQKRRSQVLSVAPEIEDMEYQITSLGASFTMANLAKNTQQAEKFKQQIVLMQNKIKALLCEKGFPSDYLDPIYVCQICKDKGFVDGKMCSCLKNEIVKQRQQSLTALSPAPNNTFEEFSLEYYSAEYTDGICPREHMTNILNYCKNFAENFRPGTKSIFMCGASGLGKTHLSCAIANVCIKNGFVVMYASSQSLFEQIEANKQDLQGFLEDILSCDLFILDDLGTEYLTPHSLSVLYNIINTRMIENKSCIFSTNIISQKNLTAKYGEKITSRILGSSKTLFFIGSDVRIQKNK